MFRAIVKCSNVRGGVFCVTTNMAHRNQTTAPLILLKELRSFGTSTARFTTLNEAKSEFNKKQKISTFGWILLVIPVSTFALGCWQVQRKKWKENLIKKVQSQINQEPAEFPDNIVELNKMEYRAVKVRGQFLHDKELYLGPRPLRNTANENNNSSGLMTRQGLIGFHIITPFKLEDSDHVILINRGWVPKDQLNRESRKTGQISEPVELVGIVRKADRRPPFFPKSNSDLHPLSPISNEHLEDSPNMSAMDPSKQTKEKCRGPWGPWTKEHFLFRDIPRMCSLTGAEPYFLDATIESTVHGGPIGGQTNISLRNEHFSYIITWYSLSALTSYIWYRRIFKRV